MKDKVKTQNVVQETKILGKSIQMYGSVENPLFLAKDVAKWIDYSQANGKYKVSQMIRNIDEFEKGVYNVATLGGNQNLWFVTEQGLYEICMQSRKPIAKQMKTEIKKYLRSIRLTGAAIESGREDEMVSYYFSQFSDDVKLAMVKDLEEKNAKLQQFYDDLLNTESVTDINTVSKQLGGIGEYTLFKFLRKKKVLFYNKDGVNIPYQRFMKDLFVVRKTPCRDGIYRDTTYATTKGLDYIRKLLHKDGILGESYAK